jgi:predicted 3-demethylubiquinone-9 3-methyltransferase (glyoxalase superfamily)
MQATPFLMFQGDAEAAIRFYESVFPDFEIVALKHWGADGPGKEGTIFQASFTVGGQTVRCFDSPPVHDFTFTPSFSLFVDCDDAAQIDAIWAALSDGGTPLMPIGDHGIGRRFGWVQDRFGISWQLHLP